MFVCLVDSLDRKSEGDLVFSRKSSLLPGSKASPSNLIQKIFLKTYLNKKNIVLLNYLMLKIIWNFQYLEEEEIIHHGVHATKMGTEDVHLHIQSEHGTGGNWCAKMLFFSLLAILFGLVGLIILENRGLSDRKLFVFLPIL